MLIRLEMLAITVKIVVMLRTLKLYRLPILFQRYYDLENGTISPAPKPSLLCTITIALAFIVC